MPNLASASFRDETKLYLLYLAAGVASVPAGICYALLAAKGWERWWTVVPLLAFGLATALFTWKHLEKKFTSRIAVRAISETYNAQGVAFGLWAVGGAAAASIVVLWTHLPNRPYIHQTNSRGQGNAFIAADAFSGNYNLSGVRRGAAGNPQ